MKSLFLCGCGTVGLNVLKIIEKKDLPFHVVGVFVRNTEKDRPGLLKEYNFTSNIDDVLNTNASMIVEAIGGITDAKTIVDWAMREDKIVVTANKALIASNLRKYLNYPKLRFEASVAGGIPIIRTIKELYMTEITSVQAILNGTCNYILDQMATENLSYADALTLAQDMGYAEADPSFDVKGHDAFQKLSILSHMLFHSGNIEPGICRGISGVLPVDIEYAREMNCVIRHVCSVQNMNPSLKIHCMPTVLPENHDLVVPKAGNSIIVDGEMRTVLKGPGAGGVPTANSIVADMMASDYNTTGGGSVLVTPYIFGQTALGRYFLRFTVMDEIGIVATIATLCKELLINIDSIIQHPERGPKISFVLTTGKTTLQSMIKLINYIISRHHWYRSSFLALLYT